MSLVSLLSNTLGLIPEQNFTQITISWTILAGILTFQATRFSLVALAKREVSWPGSVAFSNVGIPTCLDSSFATSLTTLAYDSTVDHDSSP